jgi:iron(III) transport system permease protein
LVFVLLVGFPLFELVRGALGEGWDAVRDALSGGGAAGAVANTLWVGAAVTVMSLALGVAAALVAERSRRPGLMRLGMLLPLVIPPFVSALGWAEAFGPAGLLDDWFGLALPGLFGSAGVVLVITVNTAPLAFLVIAAGLASRSDPDLERAARASGASAWVTFRTITFPLLRPAIISAAGIVFVVAVNSFGVPILLGSPAGFGTMTTHIYRDLALSADPIAFTRVLSMAAALVAITLIVVTSTDTASWLRGIAVRPGSAGGTPEARGGSRGAGWVLVVYVAVTSVIPLLALTLTALTKAVGLPRTPGNWTLDNFIEALDGASRAFGNSLLLAIGAAVLAVTLGGAVAGLGRGWRGLGTGVVLTFAVPGSALAVAVLLAYGNPLRDTLLIILIAYLAKFWALGHRPIAGSLDNLPPDFGRAARVSGAGPLVVVRTITAPLLLPAVAAGLVIVFLFAFHELTMSALLYGPGSETLAVVILNLRQLGDVTVTAAMAVTLTAIVLVGAGLLLAVRRAARSTVVE